MERKNSVEKFANDLPTLQFLPRQDGQTQTIGHFIAHIENITQKDGKCKYCMTMSKMFIFQNNFSFDRNLLTEYAGLIKLLHKALDVCWFPLAI